MIYVFFFHLIFLSKPKEPVMIQVQAKRKGTRECKWEPKLDQCPLHDHLSCTANLKISEKWSRGSLNITISNFKTEE